MKQAERIDKIIEVLAHTYPTAVCSLDFSNAFELLAATILSAQCTDARVNMVTPELFKRFPTPEKLAHAELAQIEKIIQSTGFFRQKAKSLKEMSSDIALKHGSKVPDNLDALTALRGVGRKTANVVLGNAFGKAAGVVVDTHVKRITKLLGLTKESDPVKVEIDLNKKIPGEHWINFPHWIIHHGRAICIARRPQCAQCPLLPYCPRNGLPTLKSPPKALKLNKSGDLVALKSKPKAHASKKKKR